MVMGCFVESLVLGSVGWVHLVKKQKIQVLRLFEQKIIRKHVGEQWKKVKEQDHESEESEK